MIDTQAGVKLESFEYDQESETHRYEYDLDATSPSMAVVAALSDVMDADPISLEPLSASIDTDALDALLARRRSMDGDVHVRCAHEGWLLTIHSYGVITISSMDDTRNDDSKRDIPHR